MDLEIQLPFRNKLYRCTVYIDISEDPCFVFIVLIDDELVIEFGEDVTLETDCVTLLPKADDYTELVALRQAIFDVVKTLPEFSVAQKKRKNWNDLQRKSLFSRHYLTAKTIMVK